jgi:hypothetical protein
MQTERRIYVVCLALAALISVAAAFYTLRWWRAGSDGPVIVALGLGALANATVAFMCWRALQGHRPPGGGGLTIMMRLFGAGIFLALFGPRLFAALTR